MGSQGGQLEFDRDIGLIPIGWSVFNAGYPGP